MNNIPQLSFEFSHPSTGEVASRMDFDIDPTTVPVINEEEAYILIDLGNVPDEGAPEMVSVVIGGGGTLDDSMPIEIRGQILSVCGQSLANSALMIRAASQHVLMEVPQVPTQIDFYPDTAPSLEGRRDFLLCQVTVDEDGAGRTTFAMRGYSGLWDTKTVAGETLPFIHFGMHAIRNELSTLHALMEAE